MSLADLSDRETVLQAIQEFDDLGREAFLQKYKLGESWKYQVRHNGKLYDSKAIAGAAHGFQFPEDGPLRHEDFSGGLHTHVPKLRAMGFEVVDLETQSKDQSDDPRRAFIFQANPTLYNIADAVRSLDEMNWTVAQSKNEIRVGDRVYIWQSGPAGGVIAVGTILTDPAMLPDQEGQEFIADPEKFAGEQLRVRLKIDRVLDEVISRTSLQSHPVLKDLGILRFANATNYKISPEQNRALREIIENEFMGPRDVDDALAAKIEEFRQTCPYQENLKSDDDEKAFAAQAKWAKALTADALQSPDWHTIREIFASNRYGSMGAARMMPLNVIDSGNDADLDELRRCIFDLIHGDGTLADRLAAFLDAGIRGVKEAAATKLLSVAFPEDVIPIFVVQGQHGKKKYINHPLINLTMPDADGPADLASKTNDLLRERLAPYFGTDAWGMAHFLYWLGGQQVDGRPSVPASVWWVNQGASYQQERDGGYMWAPLKDRAGRSLVFWDNLTKAREGDLVLHYAEGRVRAVGTVISEAKETPRPAGLSSEYWAEEGRMVQVAYTELSEPVALEKISQDWRIEQGAPFNRHGSPQQGYLYGLGSEFVNKVAGRFPELGLGRNEEPLGEHYEEPPFDVIFERVKAGGLAITEAMLRRYHLSLKTRGFVVLAGVSGSGKTWLTELYATAVGAEQRLVAVAPNWTTNEDLLGYLSPMSGEYQHTPVSEYLREAAAEWEKATREERSAKPFHLTLDEMNLARVEYYFARFLSAMELRARNGTAPIELAPGHEVLLTPNLYFSGTVNVDETTHAFADKVYDRAQLLVLDPDRNALAAHLGDRPYSEAVIAIWDAVHEVAPFAFRILDEIAAYVDQADQLGVGWEKALDEQILQKVLPKVKGGDQRVGSCLEELMRLTADSYPLTHEKAKTMHRGFTEHGFATYF